MPPRSTQKNKRVFEEKKHKTHTHTTVRTQIRPPRLLLVIAREPGKQWESHTNKMLKMRRGKNMRQKWAKSMAVLYIYL